MDNNTMEHIRDLVRGIREQQQAAPIDYKTLTAPCGLPCFSCPLYLAKDNKKLRVALAALFSLPPEKTGCSGCRAEKGQCGHLPVDCRVYPCAASKQLHNCSECDQFPCDLLHPYQDMAELYHNTKVFNLCLISKMGLEAWAEDKAASVLDTYSHGKWTL